MRKRVRSRGITISSSSIQNTGAISKTMSQMTMITSLRHIRKKRVSFAHYTILSKTKKGNRYVNNIP